MKKVNKQNVNVTVFTFPNETDRMALRLSESAEQFTKKFEAPHT